MTFLRLSGTSGPALLETGHSDPPPVGSISHVGTDAALEQADPFGREEIEGIDKVDPARIPDARMSMLNGWTELRLSEVIALVVEDVERRTAQAASGSRIESTESALQVAHRRTDRLGPGSAGVENGLSSHPENEKAPEMFNHFRGLVVFNNGGEIGIRTLGTVASTTDFESVPFGHSGISPTARIITAVYLSGKALFQKNACYQLLARLWSSKPCATNFFTGLDKVAQPLMEARLVDFTGSSLART